MTYRRSQNRKFQHYTVFAKVGQLKVNNDQVMCHLSMKLSDTFDQNPPCTLDKIREKPIKMKNTLTAWPWEQRSRSWQKSKHNTPWSNKHASQKKIWDGIRPITGVQLICQICYKWPTYNHRKRSTKVKSIQVNFNHCSKVSGK